MGNDAEWLGSHPENGHFWSVVALFGVCIAIRLQIYVRMLL